MFFKKLFCASAAVLMLALAYHLGASSATAQGSTDPVVGLSGGGANSSTWLAATANGDIYFTNNSGTSWTLRSNCFGGSPTPTSQSSWGALKVQSR